MQRIYEGAHDSSSGIRPLNSKATPKEVFQEKPNVRTRTRSQPTLHRTPAETPPQVDEDAGRNLNSVGRGSCTRRLAFELPSASGNHSRRSAASAQKIETSRYSAANLIRTTVRGLEAPSQSSFHHRVIFVPVKRCEIIQHGQANPRAASSPANVRRAPILF